MSRRSGKGEQGKASGAAGDAEPTVRAQLEAIRNARRSRVRWTLSRHTAERAMVAISDVRPPCSQRPSSKCRRRKRLKRLL